MIKPKPILTIKQKCKRYEHNVGGTLIHDSNCCNGTGTQEIEIYNLKDFEVDVATMTRYGLRDGFPRHKEIQIPFKNYEIKKVSEITEQMYILYNNKKIDGLQFDRYCRGLEEHNLKEDDKVVVRI